MQKRTIITAAVTGNIVTPQQHPGIPVTPRDIAEEVLDCERVGAAIAHIHVRDPETGRPSMELALYREVMQRLEDAGSNIIVNLTTGPGGRFVPTPGRPREAATGTTLLPPEARVEHVLELKPEMCTLDLNTMFSGSSVVINTPDNVRQMAEAIHGAGVLPELECFDSGDLHLARDLIDEGTIAAPALFQIVLGTKYGFDASPETLLYARSKLPEGSNWAALGIGRMEFPIVGQAFIAGGHVRAGMEDNIYIARGELTRGNGELIRRARSIVEMMGGAPATPDEAREELGLVRHRSRTVA